MFNDFSLGRRHHGDTTEENIDKKRIHPRRTVRQLTGILLAAVMVMTTCSAGFADSPGMLTLFKTWIGSHVSDVASMSGGPVYQLVVEAVGDSSRYVTPGTELTLKVAVKSSNGDATYQWVDKDVKDIPGAVTDTFRTGEIREYTEFGCRVEDEYGFCQYVWFYLGIENGLSAERLGDEYYILEPGFTADLQVTASCTEGGIQYQWYKQGYSESGFHTIEGAETDKYTVGETADYYCRVSDQYGNYKDITFSVSVDNRLQASPAGGQGDLTLEPGDDAVMEVTASCMQGELHFQWYGYDRNKEEYTAIENAVSPVYNAGKNASRSSWYCKVSDSYGNSETVWFYVFIENEFYARAADDEAYIRVQPGSGVTLQVDAGCRVGELRYQWFDNNYDKIEGEASASLTTDVITASGSYICEVSDQFGNLTAVWFYVYADNNFYVEPADGESQFYVRPESRVTMRVDAGCTVGELQYTWYDEDDNVIEGAGSNSYVIEAAQKDASYRCEVRDSYGNWDCVWFYIYLDNELYAYAAGEGNYIYVQPGSDEAVLQVEADCAVGGLQYTWYCADGSIIENESSAVCTVDPENTYREYYCLVEDQYGHSDTVRFYVYIENEFFAEAEDSITDFDMKPGESVTLRVNAGCRDGNLQYEWFDGADNLIAGETSASYTVQNVTSSTYYSCHVRDQYDSEIEINFYIYVDNALYAEAAGGISTFFTEPGMPVTLRVQAGCDVGELHYSWRKKTAYGGYEEIEGADGPAYTTEEYGTTAEYCCDVRDSYDGLESVSFTIFVGSPEVISLNTETIANIQTPGGYAYFTFVPEESGEYRFYSIGEEDTYGHLYSSDLTELTSNDDGGENYNFSVVYDLEEGEMYYYGARFLGSGMTGTFYVRLTKNDDSGSFSAEAVNSYIEAEPGETVTLEVAAESEGGSLQYQWYDDAWNPIEGETESAYVIEEAVRSQDYHCRVTDWDDFSIDVDFRVYINNHLQARAKDDITDIYVPLGSPAVLETEASCDEGDLEYTWWICELFDNYWGVDQIEGADSAVYTTPAVNTLTVYRCIVTDQYDNGFETDFYVHVENSLDVRAKDGQHDIYVQPGETADLEVEADCAVGDLDYTWYHWVEDEYSGLQKEQIEGASSAVLTTGAITYLDEYSCRVTDQYGSSVEIGFRVHIENGFYAEPEGDTDIHVPEDGAALLKVSADCTEGELYYRWVNHSTDELIYDGYGTENGIISCDFQDISDELIIYCRVEDQYGNNEQVWFYIYPDAWETPQVLTGYSDATLHVVYPEGTESGYFRIWDAENEWHYDHTGEGEQVISQALSPGFYNYEAAANKEGWYPGICRNWIICHSDNQLLLPNSLTEIEPEAFEGSAAEDVSLSSECGKIGSRAFADCENLKLVYIPNSEAEIADDAFDGANVNLALISNIENSTAVAYAKEHGIRYVIIKIQ